MATMLHSTSWLAAFGGQADGARLKRMRASPNYMPEAGVFANQVETSTKIQGSAWDLAGHYLWGQEERFPRRAPLATVSPREVLPASRPVSGLRVTWLGHSTSLVELDGVTVLTDPVWSERVSPSSVVGVRRFHPPPLPLDALPKLDAVLISHDHYDHLDMRTIEILAGMGLDFYLPLGVGAHLERWGVAGSQIHEFDWWETARIGRVELVATPARHFSGRGLFDRNATLWTSWTLVGPEHRVFFSGDTGYFAGLAEIGDRYGPFDLTMLEVGASDPAWRDIHLGPDNAVQAHLDLRGRVMLPIHWGTFNLALHAWTGPMDHLMEQRDDRGLAILTPMPGQAVEPQDADKLSLWWR